MSVLISGMKMPKTCCDCPIMAYNPDVLWMDGGRNTMGAYCCKLTGEIIFNTKREEHCPLVEVKETLRDKLKRITEPYDLFADLTPWQKWRSHIVVKIEILWWKIQKHFPWCKKKINAIKKENDDETG